jgi:2,3-bisphosphoglycerate-dependent phosphoglycerate mutase
MSGTSDAGTAAAVPTIAEYRYQIPADAADILLIRHGESRAAEPGEDFPFVNGHGDPELHPTAGREQAQRIADRLAHEPISAIYVSNLRRTAQTAEPLAQRLGLVPVVDPDLRESHLGEWEGYVWRIKIAEGDPLAMRVIDEQRWDIMPGAESEAGFAARIRGSLTRIAERHRGEMVAVFTHGGVIGQAVGDAAGAKPYPFNASSNASISQIVVSEDRWKLRRFNDTTHLTPGFTIAASPVS